MDALKTYFLHIEDAEEKIEDMFDDIEGNE